MPYQTVDFDDLLAMSEADSDLDKIEEALNFTESKGWTLLHVMPQRKTFDEEGKVNGTAESIFIFHKD